MLSAHGLACTRGERPLFAQVGFEVVPGEWVHVRGANGAGKTSLLRLLAGLAAPEAGEVRWDGEPIGAAGASYRANLHYLGHHAAVKEDLTPLENLVLAARLDGAELSEDNAVPVLHQFGLRGREEVPVRHLSAGQKRRVALARLATRKAKLWVLDEPFTSLDTRAVDMVAELVAAHLVQGGMAVLTSHQPLPLPAGKVVEL